MFDINPYSPKRIHIVKTKLILKVCVAEKL